MNSELLARADAHFRTRLGVPLQDLLQPISAEQPAGQYPKPAGVYQALQTAREADDPSLPQGPWEHELKRADWKAVSAIAAEALRTRGKDLQLAAWLLEAQIELHGLDGLAPGLVLAAQLLQRFGDALHPRDAEGEHRANVLRWINSKLLRTIKLARLTANGAAREFCWADRELAWRAEQVKSAGEPEPGQPTLQEFNEALARTPTAHWRALLAHLQDAGDACEALVQAIDAMPGDERPGMGALHSLVQQMQGMVEAELRRRGEPAQVPEEDAPPTEAVAQLASPPAPAGEPGAGERARAYAMLEQAAQMLRQTDPHSPVPYLVERAVQWGRLSTSELYQEVFIRMGGQINIFELLGLQPPAEQE